MPPRRASMGRQKIAIRRIENEEARQVCFSKRRAGLFNKASQLAILCGAEVAAVVFSPAGRPFSFGYPSAEAVTDRFLAASSSAAAAASSVPGSELNRQYVEMLALLDVETARRVRVDTDMDKERAEGAPWIDAEVATMGPGELLAYRAELAQAQVKVAARADQVLRDALHAGGRRGRQAAAMQIGAFGEQQGFVGGHRFFN